MKPMSPLAALVLVAIVPGSGQGQLDGPYRLAAGDTLRFVESSQSVVVIQTPQGDIEATSSHDAEISMTAGPGGTISAWYESLALGSNGPNGSITPATTSVVNAPYELAITPTGAVTTFSAPTPSEEIQSITDLAHQYQDFLITVPDREPAVGDTWADTLMSNESGIPETTQEHVAIRSYEVVGDTIVNGASALVIETRTSVLMESTSPMQGQPLTVTTTLEGSEQGLALFDWNAGRLLVREREGELTGIFRVNGGPQPIQFPQSMQYSARMTG